ncbi:hypothetical protein CPB83DRAFT_152349 [Crepidotus variabilis]|uniref:Uncharacterized protein n=1 Tax=Crepidotus variabilis TaxID=179855 RepID=A0A9P6E3S5_9AGAR|nr:hypothetical protein CPB83DRAFT_152349 [Crepidotus variabilis]
MNLYTSSCGGLPNQNTTHDLLQPPLTKTYPSLLHSVETSCLPMRLILEQRLTDMEIKSPDSRYPIILRELYAALLLAVTLSCTNIHVKKMQLNSKTLLHNRKSTANGAEARRCMDK